MLRILLLTLAFASLALSDNCVRYTFEEGFNELFSNDRGICSNVGLTDWNLRDYKDTWINSQHDESTKLISPQENPSCTSSFVFPMTAGGVVEVDIYMELVENADQITVIGWQVLNGTGDAAVGSAGTSPLEPNFARGWQTLRFTLSGTGTYDGYMTFTGMALSSSAVLVDSFRYLPPGMDASECELYRVEGTLTTELDEDTFWTPLNITIVVLASVLTILLLCSICYCCSRKPKVSVVVTA